MGTAYKLIGSGVLAVVLGILLYQVPDMEWYLPLPAFLAAPLLVWIGVVHRRNLQNPQKLQEETDGG